MTDFLIGAIKFTRITSFTILTLCSSSTVQIFFSYLYVYVYWYGSYAVLGSDDAKFLQRQLRGVCFRLLFICTCHRWLIFDTRYSDLRTNIITVTN
jgi:hypothetical protein